MNSFIIENKIFILRVIRIMLDFDLAALYEVETRALKQAVKRNRDRFPEDFMFELENSEIDVLVSQNVIPSKSYFGGAVPFAFTEQGVAMLSSVLKSKKAIQVNIAIIRVFVEIRKALLFHHDILSELNEVKQRLSEHDIQLNSIYDAIENLLDKKSLEQSWEERTKIGFRTQTTDIRGKN